MGSNNFGEEPTPKITKEEVMEELTESTPVQEPSHEEAEDDASKESVEDILEQLRASQGEGDALVEIGAGGVRVTTGESREGKVIPEIEEEMERQMLLQEQWFKMYKIQDLSATAEKIGKKHNLPLEEE